MRKIIVLSSIILLVFSLVACKQDSKIGNVITDTGESTKFAEEEINKAINTVINDFDFKGSTLKKVWYEQKKSDYATSGYLSNGKGSINGAKLENIISKKDFLLY